MSPHRQFTDYRSYLTETVYDPVTGVFSQRTVPHPFLDSCSEPDAAATDPPTEGITATLSRLSDQREARKRAARASLPGDPRDVFGDWPLAAGR